MLLLLLLLLLWTSRNGVKVVNRLFPRKEKVRGQLKESDDEKARGQEVNNRPCYPLAKVTVPKFVDVNRRYSNSFLCPSEVVVEGKSYYAQEKSSEGERAGWKTLRVCLWGYLRGFSCTFLYYRVNLFIWFQDWIDTRYPRTLHVEIVPARFQTWMAMASTTLELLRTSLSLLFLVSSSS